MHLLQIESLFIWLALIGYSLISAITIFAVVLRKRPERALMALMVLSVVVHSVAYGARWMRLGHVPVNNNFELLSGNILGLMIAVVLGYWLMPRARAFAAMVMPVVIMLMAWMLLLGKEESSLPPTYDTIWLYIHIGFIKLFLGSAFVALGLAIIVLLRSANIGIERFARMPDNKSIDGTIYRCMALALIFDTLGVVAGAIWAQDAWGHYWGWDKLEVWSLVTWLSISVTLHVRKPFKTTPKINAWMVVATWLIAFFTFFGIPFVSTALHKGMV